MPTFVVVYSKHIKWVPMGSQKERFKEVDVGPIDSDILITKMRPGHELDLKLVAIKSCGKDHAKFSPVGKLKHHGVQINDLLIACCIFVYLFLAFYCQIHLTIENLESSSYFKWKFTNKTMPSN